MLKKIFYITLILSIFSTYRPIMYGQSAEPTSWQLKVYKKAKKSYESTSYTRCKVLLEPQLVSPFLTKLTPYAWFYYALASYKEGSLNQAATSFKKITQFCPYWPQKEEALYWLAQIHFEQQDYLGAFYHLQSLQDAKLFKDSIRLKRHFLSQPESAAWLDTLYSLYPSDATVASAWMHQQKWLPFIVQDVEAVQQVARQFGYMDALIDPLQDLPSAKKEVYHVAVLLPFFLHEVDKHHTDIFMLDLYRGLQAAVTKLCQQGIYVVLHPYDTQKSLAITETLLAQPAMKAMDLIIGPLCDDVLPLVAAFAKENQISLFNPLSINTSVVSNNPFVYLLRPSLETQARKAAYFIQQNDDLSQARIGIIYGGTVEDSLKAHLYKQYIERLSPKGIDLMLELDEENARRFLNRFRKGMLQTEGTEGEKEILDRLTHIYIASQDELVVADVLNTLQIRKLFPTILADEGCIKKDLLTVDQLQQHRLFFIAPDYVDYQKEGVHNFRKDFYDQFGLYPSHYAMIGYDMMFFLGKMLFEYGVHFTKYRHTALFPGQIFGGYLYGLYYDNQHVPIIQFKDAGYVVCNMPNPS
jgi:hypothetical protein